jgi:hypothetical protein
MRVSASTGYVVFQRDAAVRAALFGSCGFAECCLTANISQPGGDAAGLVSGDYCVFCDLDLLQM